MIRQMPDRPNPAGSSHTTASRFLTWSIILAFVSLATWVYVSVSVRNGIVVIPNKNGPDPTFDRRIDPTGFWRTVWWYYTLSGLAFLGSVGTFFGYWLSKRANRGR